MFVTKCWKISDDMFVYSVNKTLYLLSDSEFNDELKNEAEDILFDGESSFFILDANSKLIAIYNVCKVKQDLELMELIKENELRAKKLKNKM